jgi:hypothetical protein
VVSPVQVRVSPFTLGQTCGVEEPLTDDLNGYTMTKSSIDRPLEKPVVQKLIAVRLAELDVASQLRIASR